MSNMDVNQVLAQMRVMEAAAKGISSPGIQATEQVNKSDFAQALKQAVETVNTNQAEASKLSSAYVAGSEAVDLPEVMIATQKASISFQAVSQVRNQLLSAYQEVMNMPV